MVEIKNKPSNVALAAAIATVKLAEEWLEKYAEEAGVPCRFHISETHVKHPHIPLYVGIHSKYGSKGVPLKLFLNHDKSRRDSSSTTACTIEDAMRAIDEAAAAYKAKVKK